jgi:hypothetical protein
MRTGRRRTSRDIRKTTGHSVASSRVNGRGKHATDHAEFGVIQAVYIASHSHIDKAACKSVLGSFLLLADANRSEGAVIDATESLDTNDFRADALLNCVLVLAVEQSRRHRERDAADQCGDLPSIPMQFRAVLQLPILLRHCFVLRVLLGLDENCALFPCVPRDDVKEVCSTAILALAGKGLRRQWKSDGSGHRCKLRSPKVSAKGAT